VALLKELTEGLIEDDKVVLQQLISTISNWKNDLMTPAQAAAAPKANGIGSSPTAMGCTMRI
jgi:ATP-dependent DNA helicase Rep